MTPSEFLAARKTLGLTHEEIASDLGLTPHVIAGFESGAARVPKAIEMELNWRVAHAQRNAIFAASGLPDCPVALEFQRTAAVAEQKDLLKAGEVFVAHMNNCPTCKAREEYLKRYAPPIPEMPMPASVRTVGHIESLLQRLPVPLRPPQGDKGEGRRMAVLIAVVFSLIAIAVALFGAVSGLAANGLASNWWREPLEIIATMPLCYLVGGFLAGTVYDLTRPIAHRFFGYVLRGGLMLPAIYGTVGVALPFFEKDMSWSDLPTMVLVFGVLGVVGGALLWVIHRLTGKLPAAAA